MRRLARHLFTLCATAVAGAVAMPAAAIAYLVIEDTLLPLHPAYGMPRVKTIGKPYAGNPHVRFDRGPQETEPVRHRA